MAAIPLGGLLGTNSAFQQQLGAFGNSALAFIDNTTNATWENAVVDAIVVKPAPLLEQNPAKAVPESEVEWLDRRIEEVVAVL